jgi:short-subunit dehydrogenase
VTTVLVTGEDTMPKRQPNVRSRAALLAGAAAAGAWFARGRGSLRDEVALVTGGSRGLGLVLARQLADRGARLVLCARDAGELERARREVAARGAEVLTVPCDLSDPADVSRLVEAARARFGRIDVLLNVAGIIQVGPAESLSLHDHQAAMAANYWGTVHATLAVLPEMQARRRGRIVNVTSIGGTVAVPHLLAYTASKFAAVGFSTGLAAEVAKDGVRVTTIVPGLMRTGSAWRALVKGQREREVKAFAITASLPVLTIDAERAARRILRACERGERFVTLGAHWKAVRVFAALAPAFTVAALGMVNRLLPRAPPLSAGEPAEPGFLHREGIARTPVTVLQDRAAARNNEQPGATMH